MGGSSFGGNDGISALLQQITQNKGLFGGIPNFNPGTSGPATPSQASPQSVPLGGSDGSGQPAASGGSNILQAGSDFNPATSGPAVMTAGLQQPSALGQPALNNPYVQRLMSPWGGGGFS